MLTAAGSGYSRCAGLGMTRWREDATRDHWGTYLFLRDVQSGVVWAAGYQPTGVEPDTYRVTFSEDRGQFQRRDGAITTTLEVLVSPGGRRRAPTGLGHEPRSADTRDRAGVLR
jgi:cyclic beta-1,2-glucan synthetase